MVEQFKWLIKHKRTRLFLAADGFTNKSSEAVGVVAGVSPYIPAVTLKQKCFEQSSVPDLKPSDFVVAGGYKV